MVMVDQLPGDDGKKRRNSQVRRQIIRCGGYCRLKTTWTLTLTKTRTKTTATTPAVTATKVFITNTNGR
jgi:hypothetical protein